MKPRRHRLNRRQRGRLALEVAQLVALEEVAAGRREPRSEREQFYARLLAAGRNPDPRDFILPWPLAQLEITLANFRDHEAPDAEAGETS